MAISTMKVETSVRDKFKTEVKCSNPFVIDQPIPMGGDNAGPNPLEVFLSSLGACICAIGKIISNQKRLNVKGIDVVVEGDIDKDFLMGKTTEGRSGFTELRSFVTIDADMTSEEKENFLKEIASRCPVADNIKFESNVVPCVKG
jgi:putative redox protein